jgi:hypothetical protein
VSKTHIYAGRILIYSAPSALLQHIEWAINQQLSQFITPQWVSQPLLPGSKACELSYLSKLPVAANIAKAVMSWRLVRFEITQINHKTSDATLYRVTPDLGLHQANLATNGDVYLTQDYLNQLLLHSPSHNKLKSNIDSALGNQWEVELEPYRLALASGVAENISNIG